MKMRTDIAIVLVGFNSRFYLQPCVESLQSTEWRGYSHHVVYVDNGSSDGSVEMLRQQLPSATIIANAQNAGFSKGCNQGAAATDSRYIYLLNVDTLLLPDSVSSLAEFLDQTPNAGAAGNRLLNADRSDQWSARRFPTLHNALFGRRSYLGRRFPDLRPVRHYLYKDELARGKPFPVDWVPGSCTLVRREAYNRIGGLPEEMHYWSDAVFCDRLRRAGWEIYCLPGAALIHFEGNGTGQKSRSLRRWLISDFHRGAYQFYCEHYNLGPYNPIRWTAKLGLGLRAELLRIADLVFPSPKHSDNPEHKHR